MEEVRKTAIQMQSPVKTEWNSRCVLFTYFQGDISSVVDEHFSRALSNVKSPRGLSPSSQSEDVILRNVKKIYFPPDGGPASASLAVENSLVSSVSWVLAPDKPRSPCHQHFPRTPPLLPGGNGSLLPSAGRKLVLQPPGKGPAQSAAALLRLPLFTPQTSTVYRVPLGARWVALDENTLNMKLTQTYRETDALTDPSPKTPKPLLKRRVATDCA
ncbi:hypothetical protein CB1_091784003 [Camelus ferus]|nr:hypothetical protein CB1_091784003 [Camelus ferus]